LLKRPEFSGLFQTLTIFLKSSSNLPSIAERFHSFNLLKDVNHSFRLNPKPQLQVNISAEPEYRTREEFIKLLFQKMQESYTRQEISITKKKEKLVSLLPELIKCNEESEERD